MQDRRKLHIVNRRLHDFKNARSVIDSDAAALSRTAIEFIKLLDAPFGFDVARRQDSQQKGCFRKLEDENVAKGLIATQRFALGAIFVYQLAFLYRFENTLDVCVGLKAFRKAT